MKTRKKVQGRYERTGDNGSGVRVSFVDRRSGLGTVGLNLLYMLTGDRRVVPALLISLSVGLKGPRGFIDGGEPDVSTHGAGEFIS